MLADSFGSKIKSHIIFGILPVFYIGLSFLFYFRIQAFHLNNTDPAYAYLFNGANLAGGHLEIGHTDHPGTPMQCFAAVIIFIKHLITGNGPVYQDVILHPESYLYVISVALALLLGTVTYLTARYIFRNTGNIGLSLFFQLTPAFNDTIFQRSIFPESECFIVIVSTFFMAYVYVNAFYKPEIELTNQNNNYKKYIFYALFSALLIASKFTCAPLVIICLFLAENYKQRLVYIISTVAFFLVFILPVISKLGKMYDWVISLFLHEGHYGSGKADILNPHEFKLNLADMFKTDLIFSLVYLTLTILLIVVMVIPAKKMTLKAIYKRSIVGLWLAFTVIIFVVAKHYLFTYLIPVQSCFTLAIITTYKGYFSFIESDKISRIADKIRYPLSVSMIILLLYNCVGSVYKEDGHYKSVTRVQKLLEEYKNIPVINASVYGSIYVDPSLYFGIIYSGAMRYKYFQFARKIFPNSYVVIRETGNIVFWDDQTAPPEILERSSKVLVYCKKMDSLDRVDLLHNICTWNNVLELGKSKLVYTDTVTKENIYLVESDSALATKLLSDKREIYCDLETINKDKSKFLTTETASLFDKATLVNHDEHHSGKNSIQLDKDHQYGLDFDVNVKPNYLVKATVWAKNVEHDASIVFTGTDGSFYRGTASIIDTGSDGWVQLLCKVIIPPDYKEQNAKFYIYYTGNDKAWFDDVKITVYPMQLPNNYFINADLEKTTDDLTEFISSNTQYPFQKGLLVTQKEHHSGKSSICLDAKNPFGLDVNLNVQPGDSVHATIWRKSADNNGVIVLTANDSKYFYVSKKELISKGADGWEQIECTANLPDSYKDQILKFYIYYTGSGKAYFDDPEIKVCPAK